MFSNTAAAVSSSGHLVRGFLSALSSRHNSEKTFQGKNESAVQKSLNNSPTFWSSFSWSGVTRSHSFPTWENLLC